MSLFGSKTKTTVFANSFQLSQGNPNEVSDAILYAIVSGGSIANSLLNISLNGMANKTDQMRAYAKNHYTLGLPSCSYSDAVILSDEDVAAAIAVDVVAPHGVFVDFNCVDFVSLYYAVAPFLISARRWDPSRNRIFNYPSDLSLPPEPGITYVVSVLDVSLTTNNALAEITYQINTYRTEKVFIFEEFSYRPRYEMQTTLINTDTYEEVCPVPNGLPLGKKCCIAAYYLLDSEGTPGNQRHWWFYDIKTEKHPDLDITDSIEEANNLLPVIPLRYNNLSLTRAAVQDTELYITSKKLLRKLGMDLDTLGSSIDENPDVAEIDHAYVMFGVNLQTTDNTCIRYLTEFFDHLANKSSVTMIDNANSRMSNMGTSLQNSFTSYGTSPSPAPVEFTDDWLDAEGTSITATTIGNSSETSLKEHGLNVSINYEYIQSDIVIGSIGAVGTATLTKQRREAREVKFNSNGIPIDGSTLTLKLQIAENYYKRVIVKGLIHRNYIYNGYYGVTTTLTNVIDNANENNFIIPIHYGVAAQLPVLTRNELYTQSMTVILNSVVHTKVEWYASGFFKMIIIIVAVIIAVWTGQAWVANLALAFETGAGAVLMYLLETILVSLAVSTAFEYVAKAIGPELAAILGIVVSLVAIGYAPSGMLNIGIKTLPTADVLLMTGSALMNAAQKQIAYELEDITQGMTDFTADADAKIKKLEAAKELLDVPELLSFDLLAAQSQRFIQPPTDGPSEFYDLTIHTGNIGTLVLDIIPVYHDISLRLPKAGKTALEF